MSSQPLLALSEAAELIGQQMPVDFVGICVFAEDEAGCAILLAMHGEGSSSLLQRDVVMHGGQWSANMLVGTSSGRVYVPDVRSEQGVVPLDFSLLYKRGGLCSCMAVAIGPKERPFGALLLARRAPHAFDDSWSSVWPSAAATGLLQHVRPPQVSQAARMLKTIDTAEDPVSAISAVLQSGARFMWRVTNITMGVRLALVEEGRDKALIFESQRAAAAATGAGADPRRPSNGRSVVLPSDPTADVTVRELDMHNTLLASAVLLKKARFVRDAAAYMQSVAAPARDVFTHASELVSSVVVVPLLAEDEVLGALYFTQDTPCDFSNIQEALLGFVHCVTMTLHKQLHGKLGAVRSMVARSSCRTSLESEAYRADGAGALIQQRASSSDSDAASDADASDCAPTCTGSSRLSKISSRQLCTEAMLKLLQQDIRRSRRRSVELSALADLVIHDPIGKGGFGAVYKGTWHQNPAAIKVMHSRSSDSEAVSDAMEMAVLSSVQHPNIVQVYSCLTDMVLVDEAFDSASSCPSPSTSASQRHSSARPRFRRVLPGEEVDVPTYNIVVMEFCDRGTLKEAVLGGMFHRQLPSGSIGINLAAVLDVLMEVAHSLDYLHRISLMHGDVKLDNVLLKSEAARPMGVAPKLADFGLTKIVRDAVHVVNHNGAGTVTHLAPEMFQAGTRVTTAVDTYAFGVMMWEFYTAQRPYAGLSREAVMERVHYKGARPAFPAGAYKEYADLATACWAQNPADRPPFSSVIASLQRMSGVLSAPPTRPC